MLPYVDFTFDLLDILLGPNISQTLDENSLYSRQRDACVVFRVESSQGHTTRRIDV